MSTNTNKNSVGEEKIIPTVCAAHCGGSCLLKCHVKDGVITRIETDDGPEPQLRGCLKGRSARQYVYSSERLLFPMKRVGERGEGKYERISWNEALDKIASEIVRIRDTDGPMSILMLPALGDVHYLHRSPATMKRLADMIGLIGFSVTEEIWPFQYSWNITSYGQGVAASQHTYGTFHTANNRSDLVNSKMIILWGWDPAVTVHGPGTTWYIAQARDKGAKIVAVDPKYTNTAATFADRWIPIKPATDAAMLIAMAYVMIDEDLYNKKFIDTYTIGFEKYKEYVLGIEDGIPKTPSWAEGITGVPASDIVRLAREYATIKPAALMAGISAGRTAYGEQYHRAAITLACMTGNVGISGGDAAGRAWESVWPGIEYPVKPIDDALVKGLLGPLPKAAAEAVAARPQIMPDPTPQNPPMHSNKFGEIMNMGIFKMVFTNGASNFTQGVNANVFAKGFNTIEFIAIMEQFMTPMAKYADILLPSTTFFERNDITYGAGTPFIGKINKVIDPVGECRNFIDVADELARRLGVEGYLPATEDEMIEEFASRNGVPDYKELKRTGIYKYPQSEPEVVFKKQIEDPANNPFPTPSGKIEIYSEAIASWELPDFPPIPKYIDPWEGPNDPLRKKYPLQMVSTHLKRRQLSKMDAIPWLREVQKQAVTINPQDAEDRNITDGEAVRVFNNRGEVIIPAKISERIMSGVVEIPHGAWYNTDRGGATMDENANNLTAIPNSPSGGMCYNSCLVQVEKTEK